MQEFMSKTHKNCIFYRIGNELLFFEGDVQGESYREFQHVHKKFNTKRIKNGVFNLNGPFYVVINKQSGFEVVYDFLKIVFKHPVIKQCLKKEWSTVEECSG